MADLDPRKVGEPLLTIAALPKALPLVQHHATANENVTVRSVDSVLQALRSDPPIDALAIHPEDEHARSATRLSGAAGVAVWWQGALAPRGAGPRIIVGRDVRMEQLANVAGRAGAATSGGPPVTVIATTLNEGSELPSLVADVVAQLREDDEFVLVDGGSHDGSIEALDTSDARLRVIVQPGAGISQGRNIATRAARHEVIVCVDAGCPLDPGAVDGARRPFATSNPPGLVSGVYRPSARHALDAAQAAACYPDVPQVLRPDVFLRAYTKVFGTGYDPKFPVGRCMAYSKEAWAAVGGFPEHLATGEDVSYGLAIARRYDVQTAADFSVAWVQRDSLSKTWKMYRNYGISSGDGGDKALLHRDLIRFSGYVVAAGLMSRPATRPVALAGLASYLSIPVVRYARGAHKPGGVGLLPIALVTKDVGKVTGAITGLRRARAKKENS